MRRLPILLLLILPAFSPTMHAAVPRFAPHTIALTASGTYANPYVDVTAEATLTRPDRRTTWTVPLFWDGGAGWKLRVAPDEAGSWRWTVRSNDPGLNGRNGGFECVASDRRGSIRPMADAPRHFQ